MSEKDQLQMNGAFLIAVFVTLLGFDCTAIGYMVKLAYGGNCDYSPTKQKL